MRRLGNFYLIETDEERILQIYGAKGSSGGGGDNADYYVSTSASGGGAGTIADPLTFAEAQTAISTMSAGETMAFKGGDEFYGNLSISGKTGTVNVPAYSSYIMIKQ